VFSLQPRLYYAHYVKDVCMGVVYCTVSCYYPYTYIPCLLSFCYPYIFRAILLLV